MKVNMPVTDNEVNFAEEDTLVSITDLKGSITYVNQEFIDISGFSEDELIGKNHNMVRHPDMPPAAFQDLWDTLKAGKPWVQMVKNRCKNGDYYWVKANVTPVWKDGNIVEYMSVRAMPTREEITAAQGALQLIKDGKLKLVNGNPVKTGLSTLMNKLGSIKLKQQFMTVGIIFTLLVMAIGVQLNIQKENVDFSVKELTGVEYVLPIRQLLEQIPQHRGMSGAYLNGATQFESKILQLREKIDKSFEVAFETDKRIGGTLETSNDLKEIYDDWKSLKSLAFSLTASQSFTRHTELVQKVINLIIHAGDTSNLVLDPDLDSFYNMDLVINKIPQLVEYMGQARAMGSGSVARGGVNTPEQERVLIELSVALDIAQKGVNTAYNSGSASSEEVSDILGAQAAKAEAAVSKYVQSVSKVRDGKFTGDSQTFFAESSAAIGESFKLYDLSIELLDTLLERRTTNLSFTFYTITSLTAIAILLVALIGISISRNILRTINASLSNFASISSGDYKQTLDMKGNNELTSLTRSITSMRIKIGFDVEDATKKAAASTRIKEALDNVSANVMVADKDRNIIYMNESVIKTLQNAESDIQKDLPDFNVATLMGTSIDTFHKNPAHQKQLLEKLTSTHEAALIIGGRSMDLSVSPVTNEQGTRLGTVVEWKDRTIEVAIEKEIDDIVEAASRGDLSKRVLMEGKEGFFEKLSIGLNQLLESSSSFVSDVGLLFSSLSEGDLTQPIKNDYQGDFDRIKVDANNTLNKLTEIMTQIREAANTVHTAANEIAQGNTDLSQRTEEQASSLEETASSMEEITATVKQSSDNSSEANQLASEAKNKAQQGGETVHEAVDAMKEILTSSNQINDIIGVIDEIAFQTNLLALNAAVEAARAGEQGRGFAVVAGEVRNLSKRSADAAKEIKDLIRDSVVKVETGSTLVNESGDTLGSIVHAVDRVAGMIAEVNNAAAEQTSGIEQINQAVAQMDEMTQQNAALVEEASAASEAMSEQASSMNRLIGFFKIGNYTAAPNTGVAQAPESIQTYQPKNTETANAGGGNAASFSNKDDWEDF